MELKQGYKQTELGVIPKDWEVKELCEILKFGSGKDYKHLALGDYPVYGTGGIMTYVDSFLYEGESVGIGRKGTIDKPVFLNGKFWTVDTLFYTHTFTNILPKFVYYNFLNIQWREYNEASGVPSLNKNTLDKIKVALPPLEEQQAIAEVLSDVDELIAQTEVLIAKKEAIKMGVMQELLRPKEGWHEFSLTDLVLFQEGPGVRKSQFRSSGIKLLNGTNIEKGKLVLEKTNRYISEIEAHGMYSHFLVDEGDILIACSGVSIDRFEEKVTLAEKWHLPLCMNTSTMRFKVISSLLSKMYFLYFLKSNSFKSQISHQATGSAQLNFGPSHITTIKLPIPSLAEQDEITSILSEIDCELTQLEDKLEKYINIKQGLLQQLLTGKTRLA